MSINLNSFVPLELNFIYDPYNTVKPPSVKICLRSHQRAKLIRGKPGTKRVIKYLKAAIDEIIAIRTEIKANHEKFMFIDSVISDIGSTFVNGFIPNNLFSLLINNCNEIYRINQNVLDRLTKSCNRPKITFGLHIIRDELLSDEEDDQDLN